ncbi:MAG: PD-(D/E)XK nuclease family protein [Pseudomonadota bacterium]
MVYDDLSLDCFPDRFFDHDVVLDEEKHRYSMASNKDMRFSSCTEFIGSFFEKFDAQSVAENLVLNNKKYQNRTVESVLSEWDAASEYGSMVHAEIERYLVDQVDVGDVKSEQAVVWLNEKMPVSRYQFFPELLVFSESLGLAGTIDLLAFDKKKKRYFLIDWKTNKRISSYAFKGKKGVRGPASILPDCHTMKYGLQLSLYRFILHREYEIDVCKQAIVHLKDTEAVTITCDYQFNQIQDFLVFDQRLL